MGGAKLYIFNNFKNVFIKFLKRCFQKRFYTVSNTNLRKTFRKRFYKIATRSEPGPTKSECGRMNRQTDRQTVIVYGVTSHN
jgi:hypothetical protein